MSKMLHEITTYALMIESQDVVASFSTCGGLTDSQNLTSKHSTITATIDSQSSIYGTGNELYVPLCSTIVYFLSLITSPLLKSTLLIYKHVLLFY